MISTDGALRLLLVVLTLVLAGFIAFTLRDTSAQEGGPAPAFAITTDIGKQVTPTDFGGKVLVLNFWATWCSPCIQEIPSLDAFQKHFTGSGVVVVGVSIDKNAKKYRTFLDRVHVAFQTARDPESNISSEYGTFKIPETYIIKDGRIVRKFIGEEDWTSEDITRYVQGLL